MLCNRIAIVGIVGIGALVATSFAAAADTDWPQWGGAARNFTVSHSPGKTLPWNDRPAVLWRRDAGEGYAGLVHAGGRLYTMIRRDDHEVVLAIDPQDGRTLWEHAYSAPVSASNRLDTSYGEGPNGTPLVAGGRVYTMGFTGKVRCVDAASGKLVWSHDIIGASGDGIPYFGLATSPVRHGDTAIFLADGAYAFDLASGELRWSNREFSASYASPLVAELDGRAVLIAPGAGEIVALDAGDGKLLWRHEHANKHRTILNSPILGADHRLFVSAYYIGSIALQLSADGSAVEPIWKTAELQFSYANSVRHGDDVIGFSNSTLLSADVRTGALNWRHKGLKHGNLLLAGDRLLLLDERGKLVHLRLTGDGVETIGETPLLEGRSWTAPILVGSRLYARNLDAIVAVDLARAASAADVAGARPTLRERFAGVELPAATATAFLAAKRVLMHAAWAGDAEALEAAHGGFARWNDDPLLAPLAAYYRGFASWQQAIVQQGPDALASVNRSVDELLAAIALDDRFADPHALLATIYPMYYRLDPQRAQVVGFFGNEHEQRAAELAPDDPRLAAIVALDRFYSPPQYGGDPAEGIEMLRGALKRFAPAPAANSGVLPDWGHAMTWVWYATALSRNADDGDSREAIEVAARKALDLAPDFAYARTLLPDDGERRVASD